MEENFKTEPDPFTTGGTVEEGKTTAIIAHITIIGFIIAFIMNNDKKNAFASFYIRQTLGIGLTGLALSVLNVVPILGWIISIFGSIFLFILWVISLIGAISGKEKVVPLLGVKYQEWLAGIG